MEFKEIDEDYMNRWSHAMFLLYMLNMLQFETDCNDGQGNATACHHFGEFQSVVKDDFKRAAEVYEKNCRVKNFGPSCFNFARMLIAGKGCEIDDIKAKSLFQKACEQGHLQGCHHQAIMMFYGLGSITKETDQAVRLFERTCEMGDRDSCYMAGTHFLNQENPKRDPAKAVTLLDSACQRAHGPSCFNLAVLFKSGDATVHPDLERHAYYKKLTEELVRIGGSLHGKKAA